MKLKKDSYHHKGLREARRALTRSLIGYMQFLAAKKRNKQAWKKFTEQKEITMCAEEREMCTQKLGE